MAPAVAGADISPDWTHLPKDVLVTVLSELHIRDLIRAGAACAPWRSAYTAFRLLRLPSPRQPPCLLYYSGDTPNCAAALYCPSTGANFRIPFPQLGGLSPIGSAHGWLVVADEDGTTFDEDGNLAYNFHQKPGDPTLLAPIPVNEAADCTYDRAILSCAPSSSVGGRCVVLLLHFPNCALSYARPGDERWTWIPPGDGVTGLRQRQSYCNAVYNDKDGLFYVVHFHDSIYALDLNGPSPVVKMIIPELRLGGQPYRYLVHAPCGDLLQVLRFRKEHKLPTLLEFPPDVDDYDPSVELRTGEMQLCRVDSCEQRLVKLDEGLGDHALFLGFNESLCLPVTEFPGLKPNCAYMDDSPEFMNCYKRCKKEIGV
ncbi:hypothetical protein QOZ80_9AG0683260 [Eleusine coracana subsp. coracana]|nr:hypothetical protein QOZ80_9AG0683260 [Eleusine coracana subsp. coracana]